ncbi:MAG TPA: hypothetical protein VGA24_00500, partial [Steroidobacteraceae bacterium]
GKLTLLAIGAGAMALTAQVGLGQQELEFEEAHLYLELNDTDGDLGIHGLIDGDAWKSLEIEGPNEQLLMNVWIRGNLRKQGMTELFFESDEPNFSELSPAAFLNRFPQGVYEIEGITLEGDELEAEVKLSHVLAGRPGNIKVNGQNSAANCDATLPVVSEPVTLDWNAVTQSHPTIGKSGVAVKVQQYEVVGEIEREGKIPEVLVFSAILPKTVTKFEFPEDFTALADGEMKFEIVTKLDNDNQTAVESCFEIE